MAINSISVSGDKNPVKSLSSSKTSNLSSCRLIKINFAGKDSCSSSRAHGPNINRDIKSPYFANDKVQVLSRVTAKKVTNKKPMEIISSFPLAASVYKANSDEFKLKKRVNHKVKKSVLTLPNEPVPIPKTYTVSDLNDSEYFNAANDGRANKPKKRRAVKRIKKSRLKEPAMEFRDRDASYCSQLNIDLDCSSSEIVNFPGDGERISKLSYKSNNSVNAGNYPHDVWAVLRNINKFQFKPSPPASQQSVIPLRKRRPIIRKSNNTNDTHFIETCHTEEFAYISSFEVDSKTRESCSPSSSFDRVTVIDKQSEQDEIMEQFSRNIFGSNLNFREKLKSNTNNQVRGKNKRRLKYSNKKESHDKKKIENYQALENIMHNNTSQLEVEKVTGENNNNLPLPEPISETANVFKPKEHFSDISSIKENDSTSNDQPNNFQKGVRSSDAYKSSNLKSLAKNLNTKVKMMKPIGDSEKQLNGITKVILCKGKEVVSSKLSEPQRKPRLALTLPNTYVPKLSRLEIKRRLANQKFPIVILGKDQITNRGIYVANIDAPQFEGLDKHIWPFMLEWSNEKFTENVLDIQKKEIKTKNPKHKNKINHHNDMSINMINISNHNIISKKVESKKKKDNTLPTNSNQTQLVTEVTSHVVQKSKPLCHLKNKMFHFLHKNSTSPKFATNDWSNNRQIDKVLKDKQVDTSEITNNYNNLNNRCSLTNVLHKEVPDKLIENKIVPKMYSPLRHPWAKGKWASDFIENIIKKIRSGVYYGVEHKENKHKISGSAVSTQTEISPSRNAYCQNGADFDFTSNTALKNDDLLQKIPGFDKTPTTLEIETISTNKIAVKHCVTNVIVHFDIQLLGDVKNVSHTKKSMSCIPVDVTANQEKIFKCNTSIINAILPAELCSIIPTMMRNILDSENKLLIKPAAIKNAQCYSTAVTGITESQSPHLILNSILPELPMSNAIRPLLNGKFRNMHPNCKNFASNLLHPIENMKSASTLFPIFSTQILYHRNQPSIMLHVSVNQSNTVTEKPKQDTNENNNCCKALQPYEPKRFSIVPFYGSFNIINFMKQIVGRLDLNELNNNIKIICNDVACYNTTIIISRPLLFSHFGNRSVSSLPISGNKIGVISLFNAFKKSNDCDREGIVHTLNANETNIKEEIEKSPIPSDEGKTVLRKKGRPNKVLRKKSYIRFYRKCNSMSSISSYKCTPLNRITNLEEFCQVLGSNLFCNVLDGCLEKKILSAIEEMKNWIIDISPKQALLILLLTNKKETSNLIRFRPVLLQGIAVNRITKADELDTEIEVIEKENFKLSQYEGISYLSASPKNQDSLLEELYWIAKTTASDYQKTFDESSEKLLKSLLEKRKKLNPSYLRVMARYVGLGLLAPIKL